MMKMTGRSYLVGLLMAFFFLVSASLDMCFAEVATFTPTGNMGAARQHHTETLLPNGKVLIAGGDIAISTSLASAELYDPETGTFSPTGNMMQARTAHTATLLPSGKVLITGGSYYFNNGSSVINLSNAELYDPETGTFSPTGNMGIARAMHTSTLLPNGKVLLAAGTPAAYVDNNSAD